MTTLSEEQVRRITQRSLAAGFSPEQIEQEIMSYSGGQDPEPSPIEKLQSQFEGTQAIPTESVAEVKDVGAFEGLNELIPATLADVVGGPFAGIGETFGLLPVGTRQELRDAFEEERINYLAGNPSGGRAAVAGLLEGASNLIPIAPGGYLGKKVGAKIGGAVAGRMAAGGTAGAAEGAVAAVGETAGLPTEERLKQGALMMAAATGLGALGGYRSVAGKNPTRDDAIRSFREKYFSGEIPSVEGEGFIEKARRQWFDEFRSVTRRAEGVVDEPGLAELDQILQMARTAEHTAVAPIYEHTRAFNAENTVTGESLKNVLFDLDDEVLEDLMVYGAARRNVSMYRDPQIKMSESSLGDSIGVIEAVADKYGIDPQTGQIPILDDRLRRFRDWSKRAIVDPLEEVGVFSATEVDAMVRSGEWYVPFIRATEELTEKELAEFIEPGLGVGGAPVKGKRVTRSLDSRKGLKIHNIFQEAAERSIRVHAFARRQKVRNLVGEMADEFKADFSPEVKKVETGAPGNTFRVFKGGELSHYTGDKDLLEAIETLSFKEANWVLKSARMMTRVFRAGATITPEFALRNVMRDQFTYGIYSKEGGIPFLTPARAVMEEMWERRFFTRPASKVWNEFIASPAAHATFLSGDRFILDREVDIARTASKKGVKGTVGKWAQEIKNNKLAPFQIMSQILERPGRFAEFKGARKRGASFLEASLEASDVTLNFPRAGSIGKSLNMYEAFSNAMLQDISKFSRAMADPKTRIKTATKGLAYLTAPSMAMWAKHRDNESYQAVPEWEKALFLHVYERPDGSWWRVPLPPGLLGVMFSYLPRKAADYMLGDDPDAPKEFLSEFVEQTPLQYTPLPGGLNSMEDALLRALPNAIQPLGEIAANRMPFFDRPVVSERYKRLPPAEQKGEYTSSIAKGLASGANALGMQASPLEIDHLISGYAAGMGRMAADLSGREAGLRSMLEDGIIAAPGIRGLVSSTPYGFKSQPVQDFYEFAHQANLHDQGYKKQTTDKHRESYLRLHPEALYAKEVRGLRNDLRDFGSLRDAIREDQDLTEQEKIDEVLKVDQEITRFAGEVMRAIHDAIRMDQALEEKPDATP